MNVAIIAENKKSPYTGRILFFCDVSREPFFYMEIFTEYIPKFVNVNQSFPIEL